MKSKFRLKRRADSRRWRQLELVSAIAVEISSVRTADELLWEVVRHVQSSFGYYYVHILIVDPDGQAAVVRAGWDRNGPQRDLVGLRMRTRQDGIIGWVVWTGEPELVADVSEDARYYFDDRIPHSRSELTVPILRRGNVVGILDVQDRKPGAFDEGDLLVLETLARQISVALENATLLQELADSQQALELKAQALDQYVELTASSQDDDRRRIAFEIHDGALQLLVGAHFQIQALQMASPPISPEARHHLELLGKALKECSTDMRRVIFDLYPPDLAALGLVPTLQRYRGTVARLYGSQCRMSVVGKAERLSPERELAAFRFVQEALANAFKHAPDANVNVALQFRKQGLSIKVEDNGPGFDTSVLSRKGGLGLQSMQRNAARANGSFAITSAAGSGTSVTLTITHEGEQT